MLWERRTMSEDMVSSVSCMNRSGLWRFLRAWIYGHMCKMVENSTIAFLFQVFHASEAVTLGTGSVRLRKKPRFLARGLREAGPWFERPASPWSS